jgi:RNA polymerase sigma-70 factor, ECF subfamily
VSADVQDRSGAGEQADEATLVQLAKDGNGAAFGELASVHRAGLRARCYRIIGSAADAEDAVQEGLLRAWRGLAGFQGRGSVRSWLYAIVTNAAVDVTRQRSRREVPAGFAPTVSPAGPAAGLAGQSGPGARSDAWTAADIRVSPEARYEQRESIELAFQLILHRLPASQQAVLLLREAVGYSTADIAAQLGTTPASVNSALQRARAALRRGQRASGQHPTGDATRALIHRYADALAHGDADALISMLTTASSCRH